MGGWVGPLRRRGLMPSCRHRPGSGVGRLGAHLPGPYPGWSGREDDGAGGVAAGCLGECLGGIGEAVAGGDRDRQLPASE
jgi:hypothetical protein